MAMKTRRDRVSDEAMGVLRIRAADDDDVSLGLVLKTGAPRGKRLPPVLLVHGATFGVSLFDLPLPGYSLMAELAQDGRAVYALDIRGYGHSLNGRIMDLPAEASAPFARLKDAVKDVATAVAHILAREQVPAVDLVGFSWGTVLAARYAGEYPDRVARLVLYAPLYAELNEPWLARIADPHDRTRIDPKIGAYHLITLSTIVQRWNGDIGAAEPGTRREHGLPLVIFETLAALDPKSRSHTPPAFRAPTGALVDLVSIFNGRPLYDAAKITMPTLLVRGADDTTSTDTDAKRLLAAIGSDEKQYWVIAPGSHFLCVEKNRMELYECVRKFLEFDR